MPLYEYVCSHCTHQFEELVLGGARPSCPRCHAEDVEKVLSVTAPPRSAGTPARDAPPVGACGTCGDPRGPGACRLN